MIKTMILKAFFLLLLTFPPQSRADEENKCAFLPSIDGFPWHTFWAQHYVGADLLRKELEQLSISKAQLTGIIGIWDTPKRLHGEKVSGLVAGPKPSAIIPYDGHLSYLKFENQTKEDHLKDYQTFFNHCHKKRNCPVYVNSSLRWPSYPSMTSLISLMSSRGTTFITSAGNTQSLTPSTKRNAALVERAILVSSLAPDGSPSLFTSYGDAITISVPSDNAIISYDFAGNLLLFGGTSGAAPLVTGTLGAFTLLSGYPLNTQEAKHLLTKTAIKLPKLPTGHLLGAGMLNAYKIGRVAQRLKEECDQPLSQDQRNECLSDLIRSSNVYHFEQESKELLAKVENVFPQCFSRQDDPHTEATSCQKTEAFNRLRSAALLQTNNPSIWESLACVHRLYTGEEQQGYWNKTVTEFYTSLSALSQESNSFDAIINQICEGHVITDRTLARYLSESSAIALTDRIKRNQCPPTVFAHVLQSLHPSWKSNTKEFLDSMIDHESDDNYTLMITKFLHDNFDKISPSPRKELVDKLLGHTRITSAGLVNISSLLTDYSDHFTYERKQELFDTIIHHEQTISTVLSSITSFLNQSFNKHQGAMQLFDTVATHPKANHMTYFRLIGVMDNNSDQFSNSKRSELLNYFLGQEKSTSSLLINILNFLNNNFETTPQQQVQQLVSKILDHQRANDSVLQKTANIVSQHFDQLPYSWRTHILSSLLVHEKGQAFTLNAIMRLISKWYQLIPVPKQDHYLAHILNHPRLKHTNLQTLTSQIIDKHFNDIPQERREALLDGVLGHQKINYQALNTAILYMDKYFLHMTADRRDERLNTILEHKGIEGINLNSLINYINNRGGLLSKERRTELFDKILNHPKAYTYTLELIINSTMKTNDLLSPEEIYNLCHKILLNKNINNNVLNTLTSFVETNSERIMNVQELRESLRL